MAIFLSIIVFVLSFIFLLGSYIVLVEISSGIQFSRCFSLLLSTIIFIITIK